MNGTPRESFGYRAKRTFTRLLVALLILGMGGAVVFLLSQLNARTFTLEQQRGHLVVMKGRMLPAGAVPYRPSDPRLADTYAPLPVEGQDVSSLLTQRFTDRDELDRALFPVLEAQARPLIASDEPERVERGVYYLRRAERLSGLTEEQRTSLKKMMAEVAYYQARQKLDDARRLIAEAQTQLELAAEGESRHSRTASQMLSKVNEPAAKLEEALREAVQVLSTPRSKEPPQEPTLSKPEPILTDSETQVRPPELGQDGGGSAP